MGKWDVPEETARPFLSMVPRRAGREDAFPAQLPKPVRFL